MALRRAAAKFGSVPEVGILLTESTDKALKDDETTG